MSFWRDLLDKVTRTTIGISLNLLTHFRLIATAKIPWKSLVEPGSNMTLSVSNVDLVLVPGNPANFSMFSIDDLTLAWLFVKANFNL